MANITGDDSPLSITASIVGIAAVLISLSTILQALVIYGLAYRDAPAELNRITSSISNTVDENSHRLRSTHIPGPVQLEIGKTSDRSRWADMLQEYYNAHMELNDELLRIKMDSERTNSVFNLNRIFWIFKRKDLEERVRRVETLRMRKIAVSLNALVEDVGSIKEILERIEERIPEGPLRLPAPRAPVDYDINDDLPRPLNLYSRSIISEDGANIVRTSLDSR